MAEASKSPLHPHARSELFATAGALYSFALKHAPTDKYAGPSKRAQQAQSVEHLPSTSFGKVRATSRVTALSLSLSFSLAARPVPICTICSSRVSELSPLCLQPIVSQHFSPSDFAIRGDRANAIHASMRMRKPSQAPNTAGYVAPSAQAPQLFKALVSRSDNGVNRGVVALNVYVVWL